MGSTTGAPASIGVIICTTRNPRICPQVADFIIRTVERNRPPSTLSPELQIIDLATWDLPMFNEPTIPAQISNHTQYVQPHTRSWSQEIGKHSAFIFITPQYNWGYPAAVKNAIDYLYHEWNGKPAMIVSYGGRGGGKAAEQLKQVLEGVRMKVVERMPGLAFPGKETLGLAAKGEVILMGGSEGIWRGEEGAISDAFSELLKAL